MSNHYHPCSCSICRQEFNNTGGLGSHYNSKHSNKSNRIRIPYSCLNCRQHLEDVSSLTLHIKKCVSIPIVHTYCANCNSPIYVKNGKYCSRRCSAVVTNKTRQPRTAENNKNTSIGVRKYNKSVGKINHKREFIESISGEYSKVYFRICKKCNCIFTTHHRGKITCKDCTAKDYNFYRFKFNLYHYPDLFDLDILTRVGFVSFGGKRGGKLNLDGLSRDHRVSVNESIANNYDQYYITHPINCELMSQRKNSFKHINSSISYAELIKLVDEYDNRGVH